MRTPEEIADARRTVVDTACEAGLDAEQANFLAFAASEVITNALVHGGGDADLRITAGPTGVVVEVRDRGTGFAAPPTGDRPDAADERGRGLWLAEQLCDRVEIESGPDGTTVWLIVDR